MGFVDGISRAFAYFLAAWWIWAMYRAGLLLHKEHRSKLKILAFIVVVASVLTYMSWSTAGEHFDEDADPLGGPAGLVADEDKPPPIPAQRNRGATTVFLLTFMPLAAGGLQKHDPASRATSKST
jgi:hypothetical protein